MNGRIVLRIVMIIAIVLTGISFVLIRNEALAFSPNDFVIRVNTALAGESSNTQYRFTGSGNYNLDCDSDGINEYSNITGNVICTYPSTGIYTISASGDLQSFTPNIYTNEKAKIIEFLQWGTSHWRNFESMFHSASNMIYSASDIPDLTNITSLREAFSGATLFNGDISNWDVSNVNSLENTFYAATSFNQPLDNWDVSHVTTLFSTFEFAESFNQPLDSWDVSSVTNMTNTFKYAYDFNQPLNSWQTYYVTSFNSTFYAATSFNQPLDAWNVSNATNFHAMFDSALVFNQALNTWSMENATTTSRMFRNTHNFNQPLNNWVVSQVSNMSSMFSYAAAFNGNISNWDTGNVTTMENMFNNTTVFNRDISNWNTSNVINMSAMFYQSHSFDQDISTWNIESVIDMTSFGYQAIISKQNYDYMLNAWSTQNVQHGVRLDIDSNYCDGSNARNILIMSYSWEIFDNGISCDQSINGSFIMQVDTTLTQTPGSSAQNEFRIPTYGSGYNYSVDCTNDGVFDIVNASGDATCVYDEPGIYSLKIAGDFPRIRFGKISSDAKKLLQIQEWGSNVWDDFSHAFANTTNMTITASDTPDLSNVTNMSYAFSHASSFIDGVQNFDVSNVSDMSHMFEFAEKFNDDITMWNTTLLMDASYMFAGAISFDRPLADWKIWNLADASEMFDGVKLSTSNYDVTLIAWSSAWKNSSLVFDGGNSNYCVSKDHRQSMIDTDFWVITDGGYDCYYPPIADLSLTLSRMNNDPVKAGDDVNYLVNVENHGPQVFDDTYAYLSFLIPLNATFDGLVRSPSSELLMVGSCADYGPRPTEYPKTPVLNVSLIACWQNVDRSYFPPGSSYDLILRLKATKDFDTSQDTLYAYIQYNWTYDYDIIRMEHAYDEGISIFGLTDNNNVSSVPYLISPPADTTTTTTSTTTTSTSTTTTTTTTTTTSTTTTTTSTTTTTLPLSTTTKMPTTTTATTTTNPALTPTPNSISTTSTSAPFVTTPTNTKDQSPVSTTLASGVNPQKMSSGGMLSTTGFNGYTLVAGMSFVLLGLTIRLLAYRKVRRMH